MSDNTEKRLRGTDYKTVGNKSNMVYDKATFSLIVICLQEINAQKYEILTLNLTGVPLDAVSEAPSKPATQNILSVLGKERDYHVILSSMFKN